MLERFKNFTLIWNIIKFHINYLYILWRECLKMNFFISKIYQNCKQHKIVYLNRKIPHWNLIKIFLEKFSKQNFNSKNFNFERNFYSNHVMQIILSEKYFLLNVYSYEIFLILREYRMNFKSVFREESFSNLRVIINAQTFFML